LPDLVAAPLLHGHQIAVFCTSRLTSAGTDREFKLEAFLDNTADLFESCVESFEILGESEDIKWEDYELQNIAHNAWTYYGVDDDPESRADNDHMDMASDAVLEVQRLLTGELDPDNEDAGDEEDPRFRTLCSGDAYKYAEFGRQMDDRAPIVLTVRGWSTYGQPRWLIPRILFRPLMRSDTANGEHEAVWVHEDSSKWPTVPALKSRKLGVCGSEDALVHKPRDALGSPALIFCNRFFDRSMIDPDVPPAHFAEPLEEPNEMGSQIGDRRGRNAAGTLFWALFHLANSNWYDAHRSHYLCCDSSVTVHDTIVDERLASQFRNNVAFSVLFDHVLTYS